MTPVIGHCGEVDVEGLTLSEDEVSVTLGMVHATAGATDAIFDI